MEVIKSMTMPRRKVVLSNGKHVFLRVLTDKELAFLLLIPTTVEQAQQILVRNWSMLEEVYKALEDEDYKSGLVLGCPHCGWCNTCAWMVAWVRAHRPVLDVERRVRADVCLDDSVTFGGVNYAHSGVRLRKHSIWLAADPGTNTVLFLQGHIEWARAVIRMGGVPWPVNMG